MFSISIAWGQDERSSYSLTAWRETFHVCTSVPLVLSPQHSTCAPITAKCVPTRNRPGNGRCCIPVLPTSARAPLSTRSCPKENWLKTTKTSSIYRTCPKWTITELNPSVKKISFTLPYEDTCVTVSLHYGVVPKGILTFLGFFLCMRSSVPAGHFQKISGHSLTWIVCGFFSQTPWVIVYLLFRVR